MNIDFALILVILTLITGLGALFDKFILKDRSKVSSQLVAKILENCRSLFPIFLLVLLIRSFVVEPYRIPTGSLKPSLLDGDFILVNKYDYGLRLPITNSLIMSYKKPQRGDIMVFRWPVDPTRYNFIKRVIGLPGDHISYINKTLYINGIKANLSYIKNSTDYSGNNQSWPVQVYQENLLGVKHQIYQIASQPPYDILDIIVPPHMYFMMGDNRDDSEDSRFWGFVDEKEIVGKAFRIIFSWDSLHSQFRWHRFWQAVN